MIRNWFIVCSLVTISLSTVSSAATTSTADVASDPHAATYNADTYNAATTIISFKTQDGKQDVSGKRTSSKPDPTNRRFRRNVAAVNADFEAVRNVDDTSSRTIVNDETKKISARLPPNLDRYNLFPFDYYDYNYPRGQSDELALAVKRLEELVAANELRRAASSISEKRESRLATSDASRRRHFVGSIRTENMATDPRSDFDHLSDEVVDDDDEEKNSPDIGWESRQQRSFDSLGGGLIPIKKQFDTLGGGMLPIKRRFQSKVVAKNVEEADRSLTENSNSAKRRNFDSLGGGLLPI